MAITEAFSGTEAVTTDEWSLTADSTTLQAQTDDGWYELVLDLSDMVRTDELEIRLYEKCRSGDTQRQCHMWKFKHAQTDKCPKLPLGLLLHGWEVSALATVGTITVLWSIRKVA